MKVTIEDTFLENTLQPVIRVRRDGWMIACFHYRATRYEWGRLSKSAALRFARTVAKSLRRAR